MSTTLLQTSYKDHSVQHNAVKCVFSAVTQSRWLHSLRHWSAATCLLRLQV